MFSSLSWVYGQIANIRNAFYDKGVFETCDLGARTISIGNITTGGTGKTPLVAYVADMLAKRGETVCILTRGYGRSNPSRRVLVSDTINILSNAQESGDEPFELAKKLLDKAMVIADADRVAAAEWAKRKFGITAFVLDDGFQHRGAGRDVDIVCIDATNPFGGRKMLPAGRLREPVENLKRANVIVITRADLISSIDNLKAEISTLNSAAPIFIATNEIVRITELSQFDCGETPKEKSDSTESDHSIVNSPIGNEPVFAFSGIGNPDSFFELVRRNGLNLKASEIFADHHVYSRQDIERVEKTARASGAKMLLTTAKDAVKLSKLKFQIPCFVVEIEVCLDDLDGFAALL